jgi:hypothetical protein
MIRMLAEGFLTSAVYAVLLFGGIILLCDCSAAPAGSEPGDLYAGLLLATGAVAAFGWALRGWYERRLHPWDAPKRAPRYITRPMAKRWGASLAALKERPS